MRKIERDMIAAIRAGKSKVIGNTQVSVEPVVTRVFLHGNHIATLRNNLERVEFTLAGWPTPTTRSRINALLQTFIHANARVYQTAGLQYVTVPEGPNGWQPRAISPTEWVQA